MDGLRALRLAVHDWWEEPALLILVGLAGGILCMLVLPIPFVLAAHHATAARLAEDRVASLRLWLSEGWANVRFYYQWFFLLLLVGTVFLSGVFFYGQLSATWAVPLRWLSIFVFAVWLFPQPLVLALYWQQEDRQLRTALRNALVLTAADPFSLMVFWLLLVALGGALLYLLWPLLLWLPIMAAVFSTRVLSLKLPARAS